jgi:hypothetical protein
MLKIQVSGLSEYPLCKKQFLRAKTLLRDAEENRDELMGLLHLLDSNNPGLDFVRAEFGGEYLQVYNALRQINPSSGISLTESVEDNGTKRTQDGWFDYWKNITDERTMASMGDLYVNFKVLHKMAKEGTGDEKLFVHQMLTSLRKDFDWPGRSNWLISSTRLDYQTDSLEGTITQHYQSNRTKLTKETSLVIPEYRGTIITDVLETSEGLNYLQTLFATDDDNEGIMQTLEFISEKARLDIKVWTATVKNFRKSHPKRAAGFDCNFGCFHVYGNYYMNGAGLSRGVAL